MYAIVKFKGKQYKIIGLHEISYLKNFPLPFGERVEG